MAKALFVGRSTGFFRTKAGKQMRVIKGEVYVLDEKFGKAHPDMFNSANQHVAEHEARVEQATAAPGEKREVVPPKPKPKPKTTPVKKAPAQKPSAKK